ncbi:MAG: hypothetical protein Q7R96_00845 [Nanoarchaeota archaeon]|nr:hypothetical protein [Nanoarchaeota archaeon]
MFGIIDKIYTFFRKHQKIYATPTTPTIKKYSNHKEYWFCFLPTIVARQEINTPTLTPQRGTAYIYTLNARSIIHPDPIKTVHNLTTLYNDAKKHIRSIKKGKINYVGVSLGNVLIYKLATLRPNQHLISIVPGAELGPAATDSIVTSDIVKRTLGTEKTYWKNVSMFDPIRHLNNIKTKKIHLYLAKHDLLIRYHHGEKLLHALKNHPGLYTKIYNYFDHCTSIHFAQRELRAYWKNMLTHTR